MNDRIHSYLDGEISRSMLADAERDRLAGIESAIELVAGQLRAQPAPDLAGAVMRGLPDTPAPTAALPRWHRLLGWLWAPRPVRLTLRPAYAIGALAFLALLAPALVLLGGDVPGLRPDRSGTATATPVYVQFRLDAPSASRVTLVGSFTDWQPRYEMRETSPGVWSVLVPLVPGVHDYAFLVDGKRWVPDPQAPQVDDSFGGTNSRLSLPPLPGSA